MAASAARRSSNEISTTHSSFPPATFDRGRTRENMSFGIELLVNVSLVFRTTLDRSVHADTVERDLISDAAETETSFSSIALNLVDALRISRFIAVQYAYNVRRVQKIITDPVTLGV